MFLLFALILQDAPAIDAGFPGGNIVVERLEGQTVTLRPDLRDTQGDWFYWHFRARGAGGRTLTFQLPKGKIGVLGPAVSADGGETWSWLGRESVKENAFSYAFAAGAKDVRFCVSIPYLEKDFRKFLARHEGDRNLKVETLCESKKGRKIERVHAGRLDGGARMKMLFTARHHACEMTASYALEGILETLLSDPDDGTWFRENVEVMAVPFVDKDGVEDGDQGKNRKPRDHNRDYDGESIHPAPRALREFVPKWSDGKLRFAMDMHCPTLRGGENEAIYFVGSKDPENWERIGKLAEILEKTRTGPLLYRMKDNMPYGKSWNTDKSFTLGKSSASWYREQPGIHAATTIEISYANVNGATVTAESARALGRDLARAIRKFLE